MVADVLLGLFLSGGLDSSTLLLLNSENGVSLNTFSIGFGGWEKSEQEMAKITATHFKSNHRELILESDFMEALDTLSLYYDEPYAVTSMVSYFYVSKIASKF